ncbi:Satratoxin biosynthesis SC1 cluster protein 4 [Colletotrichum sp. SAR 10_75]|nr:Satratoxin biosynthesis SC1 cluster protein 4 [Colletotrichum sp. SAR 10_75]
MRIPPISVILAWPRPNYTNPETKGPGLMIIELVFLLMALTCLGLRMYVRLVMIRKTWWDDWLMVGAMISMAAQTLFLFASGLSKLSILCSYLRIAAPGTWFSRLTWVTGILVFLLTWIFMIVLWTQCAPIWHYWTLFADWGNCIPEWPPLAGQGITTVMTDIAVYLLPMPTLFRLQMPMIQRISLAALFGLGLLVVIAGIMRTYWVLYVEITYVEDPSYDLTWDSYNIWIWTALEANFAIICGCAPAIRRLFTKGGNQSHGEPSAVSADFDGQRNL